MKIRARWRLQPLPIVLAQIAPKAQGLLERMFADPYSLGKEDRAELSPRIG